MRKRSAFRVPEVYSQTTSPFRAWPLGDALGAIWGALLERLGQALGMPGAFAFFEESHAFLRANVKAREAKWDANKVTGHGWAANALTQIPLLMWI